MKPRVVLVTGVAGFLGGNLAARLARDPEIDRVLGVDIVPPAPDLRQAMGRAEFIRADIRNPLIAKVVSAGGVDTVVHAAVTSSADSRGGRSVMKEMNVLGTMQLLAACQTAPMVERFVLKSSSAVYGASSRDPGMFTEQMGPKELPSGGYAKDAAEIEGYLRGFGRRRPEVDITALRFTNVIGPEINTALTRYFAMPVVPTVLGHDARVQLLHPEDALAVLERATLHRLPGVFNVGGDGVIMLSQALRRAGRVALPVPNTAVRPIGNLLRGTRLLDLSADQVRFLNFGRVLDTTSLKQRFGFTPRWTTRQAFDDFVTSRGLGPMVGRDWLVTVEREVRNRSASSDRVG
ncbi:NAD-dependent epimerase/dehydratase family protein [Actinoalloteichus hymeniacidonis]|uniref:Nucleoside-diphosphate-sugar epimerase n=1 Tax=Actinoalloteichus hymeniacidonis TaxID=340345 RepID=A0AAC9MWN2_9PSEU|nr:NAD-dependent epimerase/dehydratase family protein [Actinoalloteichus hymeniacidonis]AOS61304.1 nucleoside-diphosphate-sugar epimerase [Actinoalloteichus hymeniacidonis]MBB5910691.1 UDP-glucose 4-epimerase [Actinoalloteichus hymeniacidonis]